MCSGRALARTAYRGCQVDCDICQMYSGTYGQFNFIGDALLMAYWEDPEFDAEERAFYYVRVLEIPTPRWTTYDAAFYGIDLPEGVTADQQERAYTSPIWYTP